MAKIRYKKRLMPATGRMVSGSFRPSFVDGDAARDQLKKGDSGMVPTCKRGPGGMIDRTEKAPEWENTMMVVDPDCKRDANPDGNYVRRIPDRLFRSHRHSQHEIISYWAKREHNGNLSDAIRARENARRVLHQGTWMARDKAFWEGLETDNSVPRFALPPGGSTRSAIVREKGLKTVTRRGTKKASPFAKEREPNVLDPKIERQKSPKVQKMRAEQYRLFGEIAKKAGINVRKYLADGGTIQALIDEARKAQSQAES